MRRTVAPREQLPVANHQLVIGPICEHPMLPGKTRMYYCHGCGLSFLVCGKQVVVLDATGKRVDREEGLRLSETNPCSALLEFASAAPFAA